MKTKTLAAFCSCLSLFAVTSPAFSGEPGINTAAISSALQSSDVDARRRAMKELSRAISKGADVDQAVVPLIERGLRDDDPVVSRKASIALRLLAIGIYAARNPEVSGKPKGKISVDLERAPEITSRLISDARSESPETSKWAISILGMGLPKSEKIEAVLNSRFQDTIAPSAISDSKWKRRALQRHIVQALHAAGYSSPQTIETLTACVEGEDKELKTLAVEALSELKAPEALPAIVEAVEESDARTRVLLLEKMPAFGDKLEPFIPRLKKIQAESKNKREVELIERAVQSAIEGSK